MREEPPALDTPPPSHADLVTLAERWLWRQGCGVVLREFSTIVTPETPDAIGWRTGVSILIECKTSRADYLADRKKPFRRDPSEGVGDWRLYLTPKGLVTAAELPEGWGLLETDGERVYRAHGLWRGNVPWPAPFEGNKHFERAMLYSVARRLTLRGRLPEIYEPIGSTT